MNPFHFGVGSRPLFGVYHAPARRPVHAEGIVVCGPVGIDYQRTHPALRQLAQQLARRGHHVLRFDYFGTGDSGGDALSGDIDGWRGDVFAAVDELRAMSGVADISLVGVRLGGALALMAADGRADVVAVALWDPVVHGRRHREELVEVAGRGPGRGPRVEGHGNVGRALHVEGFPFSPRILREIAGLDLTRLSGASFGRLGLFLSDPDPASDTLAMRAEELGVATFRRDLPDDRVWVDGRRLGDAVLAPRLVHEVAAWLS